MQTSQIKLNEDYAVQYEGEVVRMRVQEIITRRGYDKTASTISGIVFFDDGVDTRKRVEVSPKEIVSPFEEHKALTAKREAAEAERQRVIDEKKAMQEDTVQMLAEAIGAQAVLMRYDYSDRNRRFKKWDRDAPAVIVDGSDAIEINDHAWPALVAFLERKSMTADEIKNNNSLEAQLAARELMKPTGE